MNGRFLLDTNVVIAVFGREPGVLQNLTSDIEVVVPVVVLGELFYGAFRSTKIAENIGRINELATRSSVLAPDATTAQWYGRVKSNLREKARPIPENDIWIAAIALQHSLTLVTRDDHFAEVDGLHTVEW